MITMIKVTLDKIIFTKMKYKLQAVLITFRLHCNYLMQSLINWPLYVAFAYDNSNKDFDAKAWDTEILK